MILHVIETGEGPPLVLLHGLFGAARNLGVLARALGRDFRVLSMDLRNHGDSPHAEGMDFAALAADVAETCAGLGVEKYDLCGHSLGGKTAMALALTQAHCVARLAVLDIAPVAYHHGYDDYVRAMLAMPLTPELTRHEADQRLAAVVPAAAMRAFLLNNLILGQNPHWRLGLGQLGRAMPQMLGWPELPGAKPYAGPALFLRGGDSDYVRPEADAVITSWFPQAERACIEGASHWLHADKPQDVIAKLREFFA